MRSSRTSASPWLCPIVALLAAAAVLGPEIDDGSIVYLLAKPVNRQVMGISKYVVALLATIVFGALPLLVSGLVLDCPTRRAHWDGSSVASSPGRRTPGSSSALAALTRHAVVVGLLFVLLWEGFLGGLLAGIRWLDIGAGARRSLAP